MFSHSTCRAHTPGCASVPESRGSSRLSGTPRQSFAFRPHCHHCLLAPSCRRKFNGSFNDICVGVGTRSTLGGSQIFLQKDGGHYYPARRLPSAGDSWGPNHTRSTSHLLPETDKIILRGEGMCPRTLRQGWDWNPALLLLGLGSFFHGELLIWSCLNRKSFCHCYTGFQTLIPKARV